MKQQQLHNWQRVEMPAYRTLGTMIEMLEALSRGEEIQPHDKLPGPQVEAATVAERYICLKGACKLLLVSIQRSIEAVCARRVGMIEDLTVEEVRLQDGEAVLNMLASAGGDRTN